MPCYPLHLLPLLALLLPLCYCVYNHHQLPTLANSYPHSLPILFHFYRLTTKSQLNPLIGHLSTPPEVCSSRMGPYCPEINTQVLQQYTLSMESLEEKERQAYYVEKYYRQYRAEQARQGERYGEYFTVPSDGYRAVDERVRWGLKGVLQGAGMQGVMVEP